MQVLPIDDHIEPILQKLQTQNNLVISAAPGAGKTTRLPPALMTLTEKKILVLEPRRVAALSAASRICDEQGFVLGEQVGYQVRFNNKTSKSTQLVFVTEALLARKLNEDPQLEDIGIIVLDEFHERSLHTDLAIGLLRELQMLSRPDLKIIVMSATLDAAPLSAFLGDCDFVDVPGRSYPLEIRYAKDSQLLRFGPPLLERLQHNIHSLANERAGDILVFLPGVGEITQLKNNLEESALAAKCEFISLHGSLSLQEQQQALRKSAKKKIILATNIAESALTIDGVDTVIDTGIAKNLRFNFNTGHSSLEMGRIAKSSATQRAGRAARQGPGLCLRLWNKLDEQSMPEFDTPAIFREDLCETLLLLAGQQITDFQNFSWFEKPAPGSIQQAAKQLQLWGALDQKFSLTPVGRQMLHLPTHPRLGRLLISAAHAGFASYGADWVAILSERDIFPSSRNPREQASSFSASDLILRWDYFNDHRHQSRFNTLQLSASHLLKALGRIDSQQNKVPPTSAQVAEILLPAFVDRICRRRRKQDLSAQLIDGRGLELQANSSVQEAEFFFALSLLELGNGTLSVSIASRVDLPLLRSKLASHIRSESRIQYDETTQRLRKESVEFLQKLSLGPARVSELSPEELQSHLPEIACGQWPLILKQNENLQNWHLRLQWYLQWRKIDDPLPALLPHIFTEAAYGEKNLQSLIQKDLIYFMESALPQDLVLDFHADCPTHLQVPSGSRIVLGYAPDQTPTLAVRLQEVFGWLETPKICRGKVAVLMHLLAPNYRPVQVTQDLGSFWRTGYAEVRKELRTRYPKHSWPDDPYSAPAVAKGRPTK